MKEWVIVAFDKGIRVPWVTNEPSGGKVTDPVADKLFTRTVQSYQPDNQAYATSNLNLR